MERTGRVRLISKNSFWDSRETSVGKCVPPRSWPGFLRNCGEARCLCGKSSQKEDVKGPWRGEAYRLREQLSGRPVELRIWFICSHDICIDFFLEVWRFECILQIQTFSLFPLSMMGLTDSCCIFHLNNRFSHEIKSCGGEKNAVSSSFDLGRFLSVMLTFPAIYLLFLRPT